MIKTVFIFLIAASFEVLASYNAGRVAFDQGDFPRAYKLWLKTAKANVGQINQSFQWTNSSYEQQRNAQYAIAVLYWQGKGVEQDYTQAAKWLKLAIASGHIKAQLKLGFLYLQGKGVNKDETEARNRFVIAADHGFIDAQYNLGMLYLMGIGGEKNISKAKYWLKQAALQGDGFAFEELMKFQEYSNNEIQGDNNNEIDAVRMLAEKHDTKLAINTVSVNYLSTKTVQTDAGIQSQQIVLHKPTWLLKQTGRGYAIQILAMSSLEKLNHFTSTLSANGDWVYFVKHKGKHKYFILLHCCFPNKKVAYTIKQSFSSDLKNLHPFPIRLTNVLTFVKSE